jgi:hypothetical protein
MKLTASRNLGSGVMLQTYEPTTELVPVP